MPSVVLSVRSNRRNGARRKSEWSPTPFATSGWATWSRRAAVPPRRRNDSRLSRRATESRDKMPTSLTLPSVPLLRSFSYALAGLGHLLRTQRNFRIEVAVGLVALAAGAWGRLERWEW